MKRLFIIIRFFCLNAFIFIHSIIACLWGITISLFSSDSNIVHRWCAVPWAKIVLLACGVKVEVKGVEHVKRDMPVIYMSNHQSYFDIFALLAGMPADFKFLLKQELMKIPLLGLTMRRAGYISVNRNDSKRAIKSMDVAAEKVRNGASLLVFPEGTRSKDGHVQEFKKGGFHMAFKAGCDLVPVAIVNSRAIVPKGSLRINKGTIILNIGKPIHVKDYLKADINDLIERTREAIISQMSEIEERGI
jgi:1-acyl-sn-glycerol-3-phosphate acyltransferase